MIPATAAPEVSVVIVTWNARDEVVACLASLHDGATTARWEAIVIDNASGDGTIKEVRSAAPWATVIANPTNRGLSAANNQGISASHAPFVLISNPDIVFRPGSIDALLDLLARRPRAAFAVARLRHPDGTVQTAAGDLPSLGDALLGRQVARGRPSRPSGFWWDGWAHDEECEIGHGLEACYLVRRSAIDEIGLQDERFRLDWEGIDWSARVHDAGWQVWFCPSAEVTHLGGASIRKAQARWVVRSHAGMYRYFAKRSPLPARPVLAGLFGIRALLKLVGVGVGLARYQRSHPGSHDPA